MPTHLTPMVFDEECKLLSSLYAFFLASYYFLCLRSEYSQLYSQTSAPSTELTLIIQTVIDILDFICAYIFYLKQHFRDP
jgi:hypothetical protein